MYELCWRFHSGRTPRYFLFELRSVGLRSVWCCSRLGGAAARFPRGLACRQIDDRGDAMPARNGVRCSGRSPAVRAIVCLQCCELWGRPPERGDFSIIYSSPRVSPRAIFSTRHRHLPTFLTNRNILAIITRTAGVSFDVLFNKL